MCDTVLSCTRDHLLPLARDHLLPLLNMIRGVPKEIAEMKYELENILDFINKEDKMADSIKGINMKDQHEKESKIKGIQTRIKQLIEASFHIEDVIDEYMICEEQPLGCAAGGANLVKTMILRLQIAYKIHNIKSQITEITNTSEKDHDGFQIQSSVQGSSNSTSLLQNLQEAPFHMEESDVVGFDKPRDILIDLLVNGRTDLTVVSVVAMGGQGKTTLAKKVFDNNKVVNYFDFHVWITVSQSYDMERLLRDILKKSDNPPEGIHQMNRASLVDEVRKYLQDKRYVLVFDDVWDLLFWADIEFAMIDKKKGSRILITTRKMDVANVCRKSSFVEIHELKNLNDKQSLELFNKKAFHDLNGCCPENLVDISSKIVEKCYGLPLAIVVIGGLLSCKDRSYTYDWYKFSKNINTELNEDSNIKLILSLSYHDLPYNLKQCLLYFGLYPEECLVPSKKLTQQWIAEGFVKGDRAKTLEEVAEGYLTELIHRSLVQVHSFRFDGRSKYCYVHDLVHAMILEKCEDLSFCKHISVDKQSSVTGMVRRLSVAANSDNLLEGIENSKVRSLLVYKPKTLSKSFVRTIPTKYRQLKVLNLDDDQLLEVPKDLGSLSHLKYFRFHPGYKTKFSLPKSIGMLGKLETLDLVGARFTEMPKEICKLKKLRHFKGYNMSLIQLKDGIGGMMSLQTLSGVYLDENEDENDNRVVELIEELGKLKQISELSLFGVKGKYMSAISSSINEMQQLEKLCISQSGGYDSFLHMDLKSPPFIDLDLDLNSPPPMLRKVKLDWMLDKFPGWILKLENLAKLEVKLMYSKPTDVILKLLKSMPNLMSLKITSFCFDHEDGLEKLHFQNGWFRNLKELCLTNFKNLSYILIDEGALCSLKKLHLISSMGQLKTLPTGIQHLKKLQVLNIQDVSDEFKRSIAPNEGIEHWIFKQVPFVHLNPPLITKEFVKSLHEYILRRREEMKQNQQIQQAAGNEAKGMQTSRTNRGVPNIQI